MGVSASDRISLTRPARDVMPWRSFCTRLPLLISRPMHFCPLLITCIRWLNFGIKRRHMDRISDRAGMTLPKR